MRHFRYALQNWLKSSAAHLSALQEQRCKVLPCPSCLREHASAAFACVACVARGGGCKKGVFFLGGCSDPRTQKTGRRELFQACILKPLAVSLAISVVQTLNFIYSYIDTQILTYMGVCKRYAYLQNYRSMYLIQYRSCQNNLFLKQFQELTQYFPCCARLTFSSNSTCSSHCEITALPLVLLTSIFLMHISTCCSQVQVGGKQAIRPK